MVNEYGTKLDRNGYAPSIIQYSGGDPYCYTCWRNGNGDPLNRHEIFGGAYRQKSKRLGLWVYLCHSRCHQGAGGIHNDAKLDLALKRIAQRRAMDAYGWSTQDFIAQFGRNYLED